MKALEGRAKKKKHRAEYIKTTEEEEKIFNGWHLNCKIDFSERVSALEITYDPQALLVNILEVEKYSLNPADYPHHLSTTNELMKYIAATIRLEVASEILHGRLMIFA